MRVNSIPQFNNNYRQISFKSDNGKNTAVTIQYPDTTQFQNKSEVAESKGSTLVKPLLNIMKDIGDSFRLKGNGTIEDADWNSLIYSSVAYI